MSDLALKAIAVALLVAGLIFGFNVFVDHQRDIAFYVSRLSEYSDATARAYADTGLRLLGACQERYIEVAAGAQGHYNDYRTLIEAWPR